MTRCPMLAALLFGAACAVPIGHLDALAVRDTRAPRAAAGVGEGRDCRWWILGVPLGLPRIDAAADAALAEQDGLELRDVAVISAHPAWGPVGQHCYEVRGTVWR